MSDTTPHPSFRPRCRSLMGVRVLGTGSYVPDAVITNPLFGDGAGAVLLARGGPHQGLLAYSLGSDGSGGPLLKRHACGSRTPPTAEALARGEHFMFMDGRAVFCWAVEILCD